METIKRITANIKKFLVLYSVLAIIIGWSLGVKYSAYASSHKSIYSNLIVLFVFFMIYPMMINMDWREVKRVVKEPKAVLLSIFYNYIMTPLIAYFLAKVFIHNTELALGFMLVMMIPVSSSSVGYTGIVKGSVEVAMISQAFNFLLIPILTPIYLNFVARGSNIHVPMNSIFKSILIVVIFPMIFGYITRWLIVKSKGEKGLKKIKPLTGLMTLISMLFVIFFIFFLKGNMLLAKWQILIQLGIITLIYIVLALLLETFINKKAGLNYKEHMGIIFLSTGKNNGTAVAIATMAFGPLVAIPAAVLPIFQIILLIVYIHMENLIRKYFNKKHYHHNIVREEE
ncbi:arsenic resistance protein [Marinitoga lauensis]|uniref:arsenic resistance protein n=1 Tax=Marinitoga lauensis TaxID=2201189 RepID=UPI0010126CBD|nr:bile acid:sodium symporter [Marinitoga lauensis]